MFPCSLCCSQSPQCRLLHAGGQETEAQGWCFGKMLSSTALSAITHTHTHTFTPLRDSRKMIWKHAMLTSTVWTVIICALVQTCASSLMCVHSASPRRMKIYFISETVLYNLCYLLHHLSPREHCIRRVMMSTRLYNIKRIIWSPSPPTMKWDLFNLLFILCLHIVLSKIYLGIYIFAGDYS